MDQRPREGSWYGDGDISTWVGDLDRRAARILTLLAKLGRAAERMGSLAWESEWDRTDLIEDVQSLRQMLRETIATGNPPQRAREMLEAGVEQRIADLEVALRHERSRNWELEHRCRDLDEDVWNLQRQLRNSVPAGNVGTRPLQLRTALETALQTRIAELERQIRNPTGRGRSRSV